MAAPLNRSSISAASGRTRFCVHSRSRHIRRRQKKSAHSIPFAYTPKNARELVDAQAFCVALRQMCKKHDIHLRQNGKHRPTHKRKATEHAREQREDEIELHFHTECPQCCRKFCADVAFRPKRLRKRQVRKNILQVLLDIRVIRRPHPENEVEKQAQIIRWQNARCTLFKECAQVIRLRAQAGRSFAAHRAKRGRIPKSAASRLQTCSPCAAPSLS